MEYVAHENQVNGITLKVIQDTDASDPRVDHCNASWFVCDHGNYNLGDKRGHSEAAHSIRDSRDYKPAWEEDEGLDFTYGPDLFKAIQRCSDIVSLPLYLYDHSGITISTSKFSCPWDSGQVGFAFMDKAQILNEYGGKYVTEAKREKAESIIRGEVTTYDQYLTGDVYGYVVELEDGEDWESVWGYYGLECATQEGERELAAAVEAKRIDDAFFDKLDIPAIA